MNIGLKLFEIETILSARARGELPSIPLNNVQIDLESLKDKPFDMEGIQMNYKK